MKDLYILKSVFYLVRVNFGLLQFLRVVISNFGFGVLFLYVFKFLFLVGFLLGISSLVFSGISLYDFREYILLLILELVLENIENQKKSGSLKSSDKNEVFGEGILLQKIILNVDVIVDGLVDLQVDIFSSFGMVQVLVVYSFLIQVFIGLIRFQYSDLRQLRQQGQVSFIFDDDFSREIDDKFLKEVFKIFDLIVLLFCQLLCN